MTSKVHYLILIVFIAVHFAVIEGTVDVGIQVITGSPCTPGTLSQPSSCNTCICVFMGIQFCSRACLTTTTPRSRPGSMRPTASAGQITLYPILYPNPTTQATRRTRRPPSG